MEIKFWGARGSIPVSGPEYDRYGGDTACVSLLDAKGFISIVDAGTGIRPLGKDMLARGPKSCRMFLTHSHWDHIMGFPFFAPLYKKDFVMAIAGCPGAVHDVRDMIANVMRAPNFPVDFSSIEAKIDFQNSCCGIDSNLLTAEPVPLSHPNGGNGYIFRENTKTFVFLTDNELRHKHNGGLDLEYYIKACRGADLLVHDAEYLPEEYAKHKGWGHSTWEQALELAARSGVKRLGLYHHNADRTDEQVDKLVADCRAQAAKTGVKTEIFAVAQGMRIDL
jgi:phosphoribosyl 1,2-cyclic phosphodiesterase